MNRKIGAHLRCICHSLRIREADIANRLAGAEKDARVDRATWKRWLENQNTPQLDSLQRFCTYLRRGHHLILQPPDFELDEEAFARLVASRAGEPRDVFSLILGEDVSHREAQNDGHKLFGGFYVLTRRHSSASFMCREIIHIGEVQERGIECKVITYKGAVYTGYCFRNLKLIYFVFVRPHSLYKYAARFMIANTGVETAGTTMHAIILRITTSQGLPIASECILERINALSTEQELDIRHIMSDKRGKLPEHHWLTSGEPPLVGLAELGRYAALDGHERVLQMTFVATEVPEIERRLREAPRGVR